MRLFRGCSVSSLRFRAYIRCSMKDSLKSLHFSQAKVSKFAGSRASPQA